MNKNYPPAQLEVLALGSSMSLNNLNTKTILKNIQTEEYLNCASWGQNMEEDYKLLKIVNELYLPKKLIISSTYQDFAASDKTFNYSLIENYLQNKPNIDLYYYLKNFSLSYLVKEARNATELRASKDDYEYLGYDKHGGINFTSNHFNITQKRWEGDSIASNLDSLQYKYLDSISAFCASKNIEFYFIQNPFREGYREKISKEQVKLVDEHTQKIENILNKNNQTFVDASVIKWPDSLFVDYCHLNNEGAKLLTEYFFENLPSKEDSESALSFEKNP